MTVAAEKSVSMARTPGLPRTTEAAWESTLTVGAHVQFQNENGDWIKYICARCWQPCKRVRGKLYYVWVHNVAETVWCKADKQHGPKTRYILPVPGLHVIEEMDP